MIFHTKQYNNVGRGATRSLTISWKDQEQSRCRGVKRGGETQVCQWVYWERKSEAASCFVYILVKLVGGDTLFSQKKNS
jgi:hypothetical protein